MSIIDAWGNECDEPDDERLPSRRQFTAVDPRRQRVARLADRRTRVHEFDPHVLQSVFIDGKTPETPMQALMETAPNEEPEESALEKELRFEPLRDAIDECLDERERWVVHALFWGRQGLRPIGEELGISHEHVRRIRDAALAKLGAYMLENGYDLGELPDETADELG